jgi:TolB-like protein/Flp pilus assembly protein TadD
METPVRRLHKIISEIHRRSLWQVLGVYLAASWAALEAVEGITQVAGLPKSLPALGLILLIMGLPIVLATAFIQEGVPGREPLRPKAIVSQKPAIASRRTTGPSEGKGSKGVTIQRLFSWRNAVLGGVSAFALWGVVATVLLFAGGAFTRPANTTRPPSSLAVLPFQNLSTDEDNAYFAAGIHEEILTQLSKIAGIRLSSRTSVLRYEGSEKSLAEIARELGVTVVLEGSVQWAGDGVRVTTQLINAATDEHLWAERYDREISDIFRIQTDVATRIAEALRGVLTPEERAELARRPTDDLEAYAHYLRGHEYFRGMWTRDATRAATEAYTRAVELDPGFAAAWARLVQTRLWLAWNWGEAEERTSAREALNRLEAIAPLSYETRMARGVWLYYGVQRYEEALREFDAVSDLRPDDLEVIRYQAALYRRLGRWQDAIRTMERGIELDPADASGAATLAQTYTLMRRFKDGEQYAKLAFSLDPQLYTFLMFARLAAGDTAAARSVVDSATLRLTPETTEVSRIVVDLHSGRPEQALERLRALPDRELIHRLALRVASGAVHTQLTTEYADTLRAHQERTLARIAEENVTQRSSVIGNLAVAHAYLGQDEEAVRLAEEAVELLPVSYDAFYGTRAVRDQCEVYAVVGRKDDAVDCLRYLLSIPAESVTIPLLRVDPRWHRLRDHEGFRQLVKQDN